MGNISTNLRQAARALRGNPGFTIVAVLTLALGIGANTAIFSVVYAALLRPLPYREPAMLFSLGESREQFADIRMSQVSNPDYQDWRKLVKSFTSLAAYSSDAFSLRVTDEPRNIFAAQVTSGFFSTLGVQPLLGRDFVDGDVQTDGPHVAILSFRFWQSDFGGDAGVIGRVVQVDNSPATIVGVLPRDFEFAPANSTPMWVPIHQSGDLITRRSLRWMNTIARLAPGVSAAQARAEMESITSQLSREYPKEHGSTIFVMAPLRDTIVGRIQPLLLILLGCVGFVLLIACANVANLLMTRSIGRRKEFAVRLALGARRANILSQLLTESLLLSVIGAVLGLFGAQWGISLLLAAMPEAQIRSMPYLREVATNLPVLGFLCGVTLLTALVFGLAPGLAVAHTSVNEALKNESRGGTSTGQARLRSVMVVAEIAIALVLLVGAGLMVKSVRALVGRDPGFDAHNVLTFSVNLPTNAYPNDKDNPDQNTAALQFDKKFTERLRTIRGVVEVGGATAIPVTGSASSVRFVVEGKPAAIGQEDEAQILTVTSGYFSTLKIPLYSGRLFNAIDNPKAPGVLIVNKAFANAYLGGTEDVGKKIRFTYSDKNPYLQIVGIVGDTAAVDLAEPLPPMIYSFNEQGPSTYLGYMVRTTGNPAAFVGAARAALREMDAQLPMIQPQSLEEIANQSPSVFFRRYPSYLIGSFAALALILAMIGLYGLISYTVQQRTREIGIRVALGAARRDIFSMVLGEGLRATLIGVSAGLIAGLGLTRLMSSVLYGVKPGDWVTFSGVALVLLVVAVLACTVPATRAMRVDPIVALRYE
ncbi:MAG: ABC transporter permease [Acidobacteriota bacterium]|nr:ABC transporter permease [Acidobacteriota bacterium]